MNPPMELDIWNGDWGLISIDLDCLRLVTYCKFAGAEVHINIKNHPLKTPNGQLPVFRHYNRTLCTFEAVSNYFTSKNRSPDVGLSEKQKADSIAFTMFLKEYLYPAFLYVWWVDDRNRQNISHRWYARTLPFPLNFFFPGRYHKVAKDKVEALFPHIEDEHMLETELYDRAMRCITAISHHLGTQEFMFGAHPTSIDATVFAYLALLIKVPFPNSKLKNQILCHNNLLKYVTRISQRYYAAETQAYEAKRLQEQVGDVGDPRNAFPHKRRNQILAVSFAVLAMAGYAIFTGILQIPPGWFPRNLNPTRSVRIPITYN